MLGKRQWMLEVPVGAAEGCRRSGSVQHGIQLVSQGVKHGADVIQNVLGRGAGRIAGGRTGSDQPKIRPPCWPWATVLLLRAWWVPSAS